ncbi:MAG: trypsin-like peptidase domain-containing protein [bacterium]
MQWLCARLTWFAMLLLLASQVLAEDLRQQFGTKSTACAQALLDSNTFKQAGDLKSALKSAEDAVTFDPQCVNALGWLGTMKIEQGFVEEGIEYCKRAVARSQQQWNGQIDNLAAEYCINLGLTFIKLGKLDEAFYWFSKEILLDPGDYHKQNWKAYRNMAIASMKSGDALSAAMQASQAKQAAPNKVEDEMIQTFTSQIEPSAVAFKLLTPVKAPSQPRAKRTSKGSLKRLPNLEAALKQLEHVTGMARICETNGILVYNSTTNICVFVSATARTVKPFALPEPIMKATAPGKTIFAITVAGTSLLEIGLDGKLIKSYRLPGKANDVAICPRTGIAFLSINDSIHLLSLESGKTVETELLGQLVACDPAQRIVYSAYKRGSQPRSGQILIGGRPVLFHSTPSSKDDLDLLFQGVYYNNGKIMLCAVREKAAWNGFSLDVSPDGDLVTVTGGGGYRGPDGDGYGTGVLVSQSLGQLEGFYPCSAYSKSAQFNPVTKQLAVIGTADIHVYNLGSQPAAFTEKGSFSGVAGWSPDGSLLLAGLDKEGIRAYENSLNPEEEEAYRKARTQTRDASAGLQARAEGPAVGTAESRKMPELAQFTPATTIGEAKVKAKAGAQSATTSGPPLVTDVAIYTKDSALLTKVSSILSNLKPQDVGLAVYQLKGILKDRPGFPPATCALGYAQCANNNATEGISLLIEAVRADAGQSTITSEALFYLGEAYLKAGREAEALDCLATGLLADKDHGMTIQLVTPLMKKHGIVYRGGDETAPLGANIPAAASSAPRLDWPAHRKSEKPLSTEELFMLVAQRTASIKTDSGHGSGVFITDDGYLLTNQHVVQNRSRSIEVTMFAAKNGKVEKAGVSSASIVYVDRENDIALLKVNQPQAGQKGLSISKDAPPTGMKVFAIGSPGMSERVLEQSLTEGIISSNQRMLDGQSWLQHSAAINPGNSGGPLVSQYGEIVGLVTMKANLENVGFAIPAARLRQILNPR